MQNTTAREAEGLLSARIFESVVLDQLSAFRARPFRDIARDVLADYGSFTERRLHRALARLVRRGLVLRLEGAANTDCRYRKTAPVLMAEDVP